MKATVFKWIASVTIALVVILGCDTIIGPVGDDAKVPAGADITEVESVFSDAPVSPGGLGGAGNGTGDQLVGSEDVELDAEETRSFFTAFQIDPVAEDTAGPKFVISADIDKDGLLDLISAWNQSQPVQLHLQRRDLDGNISFRTATLGGTAPLAIIAGLAVGQLDDDNNDGTIDGDDWLDIVVLSKASGGVGLCPTVPPSVISALEGEIVILFSPASDNLIPDGDRWTEMILVNPFVRDRWIHNQFPGIEFKNIEESQTKPEWSGFTALIVAEMDGVPGDDIIVALNPGECNELNQRPPLNTVDLWVNPGAGLARLSREWGAPPPDGLSRGIPVAIMWDAPQVKDLAVMDIDDDGDLDVIATWTNSLSRNIRWSRNPLIPHQPGGPDGRDEVVAGVSHPGADFCTGGGNDGGPCPDGDVDCPGLASGTCTGGICVGGQNDGEPCALPLDCPGAAAGTCTTNSWRFLASGWERRPIGQIDTGADVMTLGDVDRDGEEDIIVRSTDGQIVQWFRQPNSLVVAPEFPPNDPVPDRFNFPWPVFTLTAFSGQEPEGITLGDVTGDGQLELMVAVDGGVYWYDATLADSVYDVWFPNTIIQNSPPGGGASTGSDLEGAAPGSGVGVDAVDTSTSINSLLVVDLDGDGKNDIIATLDRRTDGGLSDDRLVWYRNTRQDEQE